MVVWNVYKIKLLVVGRDRPSVGTGRDLSLPMAAEYPIFKIHFLEFHHKFNRNLRKKPGVASESKAILQIRLPFP